MPISARQIQLLRQDFDKELSIKTKPTFVQVGNETSKLNYIKLAPIKF